MAIDAGHRRVEAGIRNSPHADPAVVVRHVLDQPINCVVSVSRLIDLVAALVWDVRPHIFIDAFAAVTPAHVFVNKDVPFAGRSEEHTSELQSRGLISYAV